MRLVRRRGPVRAMQTPMRYRGAMVKRKSATAMHGGQARARQIWREVAIQRAGKG